MTNKNPSLFSIPPGAPFLDTLVAAIADGRFGFALDLDRDPLALADITLFLPTRRAARSIRESFARIFCKPVLLPSIQALGDVDEDELALLNLIVGQASPVLPAVTAAHRHMVLTRLVLHWSAAAARGQVDLPDEPLLVPASPADASRLAARLGRLIDEAISVGADWQGLSGLVDSELAGYWEITRQFLEIVSQAWPSYLAEAGLVDPATRRDTLIRAHAARLAEVAPKQPVIAAGSTGSLPATAELLDAIARLPFGAVVLPGLDFDLDEDTWSAVDADDEPARLSHPQYGLKRLLRRMNLSRGDVRPLVAPSEELAGRAVLVSEALRPADRTDAWAREGSSEIDFDGALGQVSVIEAENEREEALAVAVILRQALETPDTTVALVTPDRGLAARVAIELRRWNISVDDSGGVPLDRTEPGVAAQLVAEAAISDADAGTLLALLKHPLTDLADDRANVARQARLLELAAFRGPKIRKTDADAPFAAIRAVIERRRAAPSPRRRGAIAAETLVDADFAVAAALLDRLEVALAPLAGLAGSRRPQPLAALIEAHIESLKRVIGQADGALDQVTGGAQPALARFLADLLQAAQQAPEIMPADYPALFAALASETVWRNPYRTDPRIHIWGALEARLQYVDVAVLGGLNEGTWPSPARTDPFLSRSMRAALGHLPPERRIGQAAHDFTQLLGHPVVWLSRARRDNGGPRTASRWLQRLLTRVGKTQADAMRNRGGRVISWASTLDTAPQPVRPATRPAPRPPVAARPSRLSVTRIEKLIRDPYAIYAERILGLQPLEEIAESPGPRERGIIIHGALERFVRQQPRGPFDAPALEILVTIGQETFADLQLAPEFEAAWWPRFERMARWFVETESGRSEISERHVELRGRMPVGDNFLLTGRADRIDRLDDGRFGIIDYKSGSPPSPDEALSVSPQLLLEALILSEGGFAGLAAGEVARLEYYQVGGAGEGGKIGAVGKRTAKGGRDPMTLQQSLVMTRQRLAALITSYNDSDTSYISRARPKSFLRYGGDYDHLARVGEWLVEPEAEE